MSSKRKSSALGLQRRVRPRREDAWQPEADVEDSVEEASEEEGGYEDSEPEDDNQGEEGTQSEEGSEDEESETDDGPKADLASVSFGALARAQASLPGLDRRKKHQKVETTTTEEAPVARPRKSKMESSKPQRSSKHAPQEQSSKRPVSRRREIIADPRTKYRDPRFDPLGNTRVDAARASKAYAFLDEYRESEMAELRTQIKKTKDPNAKEELKRELMSMESKKKAKQKKDDEEKLLADHRKQEKELVAQGKKPFYLKKSEQKKRLLMDRFAGMSKGQVDKAIAKKRKKVAGREKKELDSLQRVRSRHER